MPTSSDGSARNSATRRWGLTERRWDNTFDNFDLALAPEMRAAYDRCRAVNEGREWCAFLVGSTGNGKTHLAVAAMHGFESGDSRFWKVPGFLAWLRSELNKGIEAGYGGAKVEEILGHYREPFLLVLDDLGAENPTEWANEQLYRLLDERYEERAPTIITSNVPVGAIDARIRSRFREGYVACAGKDVRA